MRIALTIAGSDSGGGAGIQADLTVFRDLGVWGASAVTCLTAQSPAAVIRIEPTTPAMVTEQIAAVSGHLPVAAVKIGMVCSAEIVTAVAAALQEHLAGVPVVLDPVMRASSGASLLEPTGEEALIEHLLPLATVVTPNLAEAAVLAAMPTVKSLADMEEAACRIAGGTPGAVMVTGGHLRADAVDVVLTEGVLTHLSGPRIAGGDIHGTGCALASAIAAGLALGLPLLDTIRRAKSYVAGLIEGRVRLTPDSWGLGFGPVALAPGKS